MCKLKKTAVAFCVVTGIYLMIPALVRDVSPTSCTKWEDRVVRVEAISADQLMRIAHDTRVVVLPTRMRIVLPRRGISLPGVVAVVESKSNYDNAHLRWHEMVHQHQYERDGIFIFFKNYAADFHAGLFKGCTFHAAYRAIKYEIEAELAADSLYNHTDRYSAILHPALVNLDEVYVPGNSSLGGYAYK